MKELRGYQIESLNRLAKDAAGLDASEMGTGKSIVAVNRVAQIKHDGTLRVLVCAPINTHAQWRNLFIEQFPALGENDMAHIVSTPGASPKAWELMTRKQSGVFILGWEAMRGALPEAVRAKNSRALRKNPPVTVKAVKSAMRTGLIPPWHKTGAWDLVIGDEIHRAANRSSLQFYVLRQIATTNKLALSGTPAGNKEEGMWSVLNWLWPEKYNNFWAWAEAHLNIESEQVSKTKTIKKITGEKFPGSVWTSIPCVVRHRLADVAGELPQVIQRIVTIGMGATQAEQYDEFAEQSLAWIDDNPVAAVLPLVQRIRLRQAALGTLKNTLAWKRHTHAYDVEALGDLLARDDVRGIRYLSHGIGELDGRPTVKVSAEYEELDLDFAETSDQPKLRMVGEIITDLPPEEPVIVFTHSSKWARMAAKKLNGKPDIGAVETWTGATTPKKREKLKAQITNYRTTGEGARVLIAQVQALSEGADGFQHGCSCEIWASPSEDQVTNQQAQNRLHRPGQDRPVQRWLLHTLDSIDVDVDTSLAMRRKRMSKMYRDKEGSA